MVLLRQKSGFCSNILQMFGIIILNIIKMRMQQVWQGNHNFRDNKRVSNQVYLPIQTYRSKSRYKTFKSQRNSPLNKSPIKLEQQKNALTLSSVIPDIIRTKKSHFSNMYAKTPRPYTARYQNQEHLMKKNQLQISQQIENRQQRTKSNYNLAQIFDRQGKRYSEKNKYQQGNQGTSIFIKQQYELQKVYRRGKIEQTKKTVQKFNQNNLQLLDNIKRFRNEVSSRASPMISPQKRSPQKINFKNSLQTNYSDNSGYNLPVDKIAKAFQKYETSLIQEQNQNKFSDDNFMIIKKLGQGTFANVYLAVQKQSGFLVTLKRIKKSILQNIKCQQQLIAQIKIQLFANHPNVLKIYGFYFDCQSVTLILQFMQEANLYERLKQQKKLTQQQTSQSICEILFALKYLHDHKIVHRDIKPQNVVLSYHVRKLCDFGTATICNDRRATVCGTLDYSAPQLIQGHQYNAALDIWSVGVMIYELLTGKPPFYHMRRKDTIKQIIQYRDGQIKYPSELSVECIDFLSRFLLKDPQKRIGIDEALRHKFIQIYADEQTKQLRQKYMRQGI